MNYELYIYMMNISRIKKKSIVVCNMERLIYLVFMWERISFRFPTIRRKKSLKKKKKKE